MNTCLCGKHSQGPGHCEVCSSSIPATHDEQKEYELALLIQNVNSYNDTADEQLGLVQYQGNKAAKLVLQKGEVT